MFRSFVASVAVNTHPTLQDQVKSAAEAAGQPELSSYIEDHEQMAQLLHGWNGPLLHGDGQ